MNLHLIIVFMFLSSLFSYAQKAEYEIIHKEPLFYEFNLNRDKIFIYDYEKNLSVYDVNTYKTSLIEANVAAETGSNIKNPFISTLDGKMLFVTETHVCELTDNKLIRKAKFVYDDYGTSVNDNSKEQEEKQELEKLNQLITDYQDNNIIRYKKKFDIYVFNYQNGNAFAMYGRRLVGLYPLNKENITKINKLAKTIENTSDTTYSIEIKKSNNVINYFEDKKISIEEKSYSCKKEGFMSLVSDCRYKIKIKYKNNTVELKNEDRTTSFSFWNDNNLLVDLNKNIPFSKYITDTKGNIYLVFDIEKETKLIKIPIEQFEARQ